MVQHIGQNSNIKTYTRGLGKQATDSSHAKRTKSKYDYSSYRVESFAKMRKAANPFGKSGSIFRTPAYTGLNTCSGSSNDAAAIIGAIAGKALSSLFGGSKSSNTQVIQSQSVNTSTVSSSLTGQLSSANSFSKISSLELEAETQKASLKSDYKELDISDSLKKTLETEDVKSGLNLAGVSLDTNSIALSDLNPDDLEDSMKTIDKDINKVTNFQTSDVPKAEAKVTQKSGEVTQQITSVTSQITKLEAQKAAATEGTDTSNIESQIEKLKSQKVELEKQKSQLDAAKTALDDVKNQCASTIESLQAKKSEVSELKKFEDEVKDKKYDLAKEQDENLKKTMEKIDKLTKEIDSLKDKNTDKADKSDQKRLQKYNSLISERSGLYTTLSTLTASLASAGATDFENSKGNTYTLQNLDKALEYGKDDSNN